MSGDPLEALMWIELPTDMDRDLGSFTLDPAVPLPIEPDPGEELRVQSLSWERITAAMLLVLANSPSHEHAPYYRAFLAALQPGLAGVLLRVSEDRTLEKNWSQAETALLALRGLEPDALEPRHALAKLYDVHSDQERRTGNTEQAEILATLAEAAYSEILADDAVPQQAYFDAGMFRYRRADFAKAASNLETYLETAPAGAEQDAALRLLRLCRDEGQADELYRNAYAALKEGRIPEGVEMAEEFRDKHPEGWPGWFLLGWGLRLSGDWEGAEQTLIGAAERGCREGDLYNELAICTRSLGNFDAAVSALEQALRLDPENTKIISNMAVLHREKGDDAEALRWLGSALALNPDDNLNRRLLSEWETGP